VSCTYRDRQHGDVICELTLPAESVIDRSWARLPPSRIPRDRPRRLVAWADHPPRLARACFRALDHPVPPGAPLRIAMHAGRSTVPGPRRGPKCVGGSRLPNPIAPSECRPFPADSFNLLLSAMLRTANKTCFMSGVRLARLTSGPSDAGGAPRAIRRPGTALTSACSSRPRAGSDGWSRTRASRQ